MSPSLFPSSLLRRRRCADPDSDENSFLNPKTKAHHSCNKNCWTFRSLSCAPKIFNYRIFIYIHTHTYLSISPFTHQHKNTHIHTSYTHYINSCRTSEGEEGDHAPNIVKQRRRKKSRSLFISFIKLCLVLIVN